MSEAGEARLRRDIGTLGATLLVLNGLIGAGIFALPGRVAANAGLASPWLFLVVGLAFLTVVLSFAALASYFDESGGPAVYASEAFGPLVGFGTGWILFISRVTAFAANITVMATYLGGVVPWFGDGIGRAVLITGFIAGLTWANVLGVRDGMRTMLVLSVLKITPLLLLILLGLSHVTGATLLPGADATIDKLGETSLLLIYAFVGFETIGITAGETANPRKRLPRALVRTVLAIAVLYFLIVLVYVSVIPPSAYAEATLVDVGRALAGGVGGLAIALAAVFSIAGNLSSIMLGIPRLLFALGEHGMISRHFASVHPRFHTPHVAIVSMGGLCLALALSGTFSALAVASSLSRLLAYVVCIAALPRIARGASEAIRAEAFALPGGILIPLIALGICIVLILQTTLANWIAVGALLAVGAVLYLVERRAASRQRPAC